MELVVDRYVNFPFWLFTKKSNENEEHVSNLTA